MEISSYKDLSLKKNSVLFKENSKGNHIFLVSKGEIITVKKSKGRYYPTGLHREGDFIGSGIIAGDEYFENAIARESSVLIPLPIDDIGNVATKCPGWIRSLLRTIITRLQGGVQLMTDQKIMEDLSEYSQEYSLEDEAAYRRAIEE